MEAGRQGNLNVPDLVVGGVLLLLIPILTMVGVKGTRVDPPPEPAAAAQDPLGKAPLTPEECGDEEEVYSRIYKDNAQVFITRSQDPELEPKALAQEVSWARAALTRCRKGFASLIERARRPGARPEVAARIPTYEAWLSRLDDQMRTLDVAVKGAASPSP